MKCFELPSLERVSKGIDGTVIGADVHLTVAGPEISWRHVRRHCLSAVPEFATRSRVERIQPRRSLRTAARCGEDDVVDDNRRRRCDKIPRRPSALEARFIALTHNPERDDPARARHEQPGSGRRLLKW